MTTRVFLVRHGATRLSAEDRFAGATDVELSDEGRWQARCLAERLADQPLAAAYSSPMARTRDTAAAVIEPHRLTLEVRDGLREISHGAWEGMTRAEVEASDAADYARWESDPFSFAPRGGETGLEVTARALPVLLDIVAEHPEAQVLVVSHKATIRLLTSSLLGFDARTYRDRLDMALCALNILDFDRERHARLTLFNDISHYSPLAGRIPPIPGRRLSKWWDRQR